MKQPKTRNYIAVAANLRGGAGKHGGSAKQNNRRNRKSTKQALRAGKEAL